VLEGRAVDGLGVGTPVENRQLSAGPEDAARFTEDGGVVVELVPNVREERTVAGVWRQRRRGSFGFDALHVGQSGFGQFFVKTREHFRGDIYGEDASGGGDAAGDGQGEVACACADVGDDGAGLETEASEDFFGGQPVLAVRILEAVHLRGAEAAFVHDVGPALL